MSTTHPLFPPNPFSLPYVIEPATRGARKILARKNEVEQRESRENENLAYSYTKTVVRFTISLQVLDLNFMSDEKVRWFFHDRNTIGENPRSYGRDTAMSFFEKYLINQTYLYHLGKDRATSITSPPFPFFRSH